MKAVLIAEPQALHPFRTPLDALTLTGETLAGRLKRQLACCGFDDVRERAADALVASDFPALVSWPGAVVSDAALRALARLPQRPYQVAFNDRDHELLGWTGRPEVVRPLRLRWCLQPSDLTDELPLRDFAAPAELKVAVRLAAAVYGAPNATIHFATTYGRQVETWADLHILASLRAREYSATRVRPFVGRVPAKLLAKLADAPAVLRRLNRIGRNCRIHPSAVLEGCVIGDDVEIGPACYLRSAWIGSGVTLREFSSVKVSVIEAGAYVMRCDMFNSVVGAGALIVTDSLYNSWVGDGSFIGGGSGFSDFNATRQPIELQLPAGRVDSGLRLLGSAVGEDCFIGAGLLFRPGLAIPAGSRILSAAMIDRAPSEAGGVHVASGGRLIQVPGQFMAGGSAT